jgi:hypothetical protein
MVNMLHNLNRDGLVRFPVGSPETSQGSYDQRVQCTAHEDDGRRRRPLSVDLGHKTKDAVIEFGRAARGLYQLRNSSRNAELRKSDPNLMILTPSMHDIDNLIPTFSPASSPKVEGLRRLCALDATKERHHHSNMVTPDHASRTAQRHVGLGLEGSIRRIPILTYNDAASDAHFNESFQTNQRQSSSPLRPMPKQLQADEKLFAGPRDSGGHRMSSLVLDRVEIALEDVEHDSPLFRAALQSVEKRTLIVKRAAKALYKSAEDCVSAIEALDAAELRIEQNLESMSSLMPSTLGLLQRSVLVDVHGARRQQRQSARNELEAHVLSPMRGLYELCKALLSQFKSFETDSRSYYASTQKWLSSRSPTVNRTEDEGLYSPEAVGFDRSNAKQDRLDDKQHIRQATFDLSRFTIYRSMCLMHAGQAELMLASHMLAWCRSSERSVGQEERMHSLKEQMRMHESQISQHIIAADDRCRHIRSIIIQARLIARKDDPDHAEHADIDDPSAVLIMRKLDTLKRQSALLGLQVQSKHLETASCPLPQSASSIYVDNNAKSVARNEITQQANAEFGTGPALSDAPSSAKRWQARLRSLSFSKQTQELCDVGSTRASLNEQRSPKPDRCNNRQQRRSLSFTSINGTPMLNHPLGSKIQGEQRETKASTSPTTSVAAPLKATRKREGILWVMAKPIQGLSSGDAPRAVTRATNWRECWVVLSGSGHLSEYANWKEAGCPSAFETLKPIIDLRFATVRKPRGIERRFTFEVVTREQRHFFQASNDSEMHAWISAIGLAIESLINGTSSVRQIEKVARHVGEVTRFGDDAQHDSAVRRIFDWGNASNDSTSLGIRAAFSQSLTDLGSATSAKLFMRGSREGGGRTRAGKHEGKSLDHPRGLHLNALSEGGTGSDVSQDAAKKKDRHSRLAVSQEEEEDDDDEDDDVDLDADIPQSLSMTPAHSRGISNTTPLAGYLSRIQAGEVLAVHAKDWSASQSAPTALLNVCTDFDKRIELLVNNSYGQASPLGSSCHTSSGSNSRIEDANLSSVTPSLNTSSNSQTLAQGERGSSVSHTYDGSNKYSRAQEIQYIAGLEGNNLCADCLAPEPRWASWSLNGANVCIFICITCSGVHRSLGVHVSKVRSVDLDDWTDEQLAAARTWGNERANRLYERRKPYVCTVESMGGTRTKAFWSAKYVNRLWFVDTGGTADQAHEASQHIPEKCKVRPSSYAGVPSRRPVERNTTCSVNADLLL